MLIQRQSLSHVTRLLSIFPVVGITGPRQVGKTTFVRRQLPPSESREDVYLDLENPRDRAKLADPYDFFERRADERVIGDEVQLMPELFTLLRPLVDADRRPGRFLLLGSASPQLIRGPNDSLAGRVAYAELRPLCFAELSAYPELRRRHWVRGGYPDALLTDDDEASELWRVRYLETYVTKELPALGSVGQPDVMRRLLRMLAAQSGDVANYSSLARALGVTQATAKGYTSLLEQSFLVRLLPPFHVNVRKRLVKAPKIYLRDSGLLHSLLGIGDEDQLTASVAGGASWEGYVIEQLTAAVRVTTAVYFYRTHAGAEIDLVLVGRAGRIACVEVKRSSAPKLTKGFYTAREDLGPELTLVVALVDEAYSLGDGVEVVDLSDAIERLRDW